MLLELIEVQTGSYLGEDDIIRLDDEFGRSLRSGFVRQHALLSAPLPARDTTRRFAPRRRAAVSAASSRAPSAALAAHQLARRPVGLRRIGDDAALKADDLRDQPGEFQNGQVFARTDIDVRRRPNRCASGTQARRRNRRHAGTRGAAVPVPQMVRCLGAGELRLMRLADQRRQHVARLEVEIVARPVEIGRHGGDEVGAVLRAIGGGKLDAGDLGDGIGLVGRLERPGQKSVLDDRLRRELRIDAA